MCQCQCNCKPQELSPWDKTLADYRTAFDVQRQREAIEKFLTPEKIVTKLGLVFKPMASYIARGCSPNTSTDATLLALDELKAATIEPQFDSYVRLDCAPLAAFLSQSKVFGMLTDPSRGVIVSVHRYTKVWVAICHAGYPSDDRAKEEIDTFLHIPERVFDRLTVLATPYELKVFADNVATLFPLDKYNHPPLNEDNYPVGVREALEKLL